MKQKFYSMYGTAIDRYGDEHIVTIVGEFIQEKVETCVTTEVNIEDEYKPNKVVKRSFKLSY